MIAFTTAVAEHVGPSARWLHFGLTSSDVVDTALARGAVLEFLTDARLPDIALDDLLEDLRRDMPLLGAERFANHIDLSLEDFQRARRRSAEIGSNENQRHDSNAIKCPSDTVSAG